MSDEEYVPPADADSDVSSDEDKDLAGGDVALASGDEEVVATAVSSSTSYSPRRRHRKIRRLTVSPTAPVLVGMDLSE